MTCSILDNLKTDLRKQNLTNKNLEAPLSQEGALTKYVLNLTRTAKNTYKVDMGNIFTIRKNAQNLTLIPNTAALEAIERSKPFEQAQISQNSSQKLSSLDKNQVVDDISEAGKPIDNQAPKLNVKGLPELEITC